jgi:hypothetical protein
LVDSRNGANKIADTDSFITSGPLSGVSEVVQKGAKRFVRITILAGYKLCSCPLGRLGGH